MISHGSNSLASDDFLKFLLDKMLQLPRELEGPWRDPHEVFYLHLVSGNKTQDQYECWLSAFDPVKKRFTGYFCGFDMEKSDSFPFNDIFRQDLTLRLIWRLSPSRQGSFGLGILKKKSPLNVF